MRTEAIKAEVAPLSPHDSVLSPGPAPTVRDDSDRSVDQDQDALRYLLGVRYLKQLRKLRQEACRAARDRMGAAGYTQRAVAEAIGLGQRQYERWEVQVTLPGEGLASARDESKGLSAEGLASAEAKGLSAEGLLSPQPSSLSPQPSSLSPQPSSLSADVTHLRDEAFTALMVYLGGSFDHWRAIHMLPLRGRVQRLQAQREVDRMAREQARVALAELRALAALDAEDDVLAVTDFLQTYPEYAGMVRDLLMKARSLGNGRKSGRAPRRKSSVVAPGQG